MSLQAKSLLESTLSKEEITLCFDYFTKALSGVYDTFENVALLNKAISINANFLEARLWRAYSTFGFANSKHSIDDLNFISQKALPSEHIYILAKVALSTTKERDFHKAIKLLNFSLERKDWTDEERGELLWARGRCYLFLGVNNQAILDCLEAVKLNFRPQMVHLSLGLIFNSIGDKEMSTLHFQKALAIERIPRILFELCTVLVTQNSGNWSDSELTIVTRMLEEILEKNPSYKGVYSLLGVTSEPTKKLTFFTKELQLNPNDIHSILFLVNAKLQIHHNDEALEIINKSLDTISFPPTRSQLLEARATIKESLGEIEDAVEDYTQASELNPINKIPQISLAKYAESLGDFSNALQRYQNVLFLHPNEVVCISKIKELMETHKLPPPKDFRPAMGEGTALLNYVINWMDVESNERVMRILAALASTDEEIHQTIIAQYPNVLLRSLLSIDTQVAVLCKKALRNILPNMNFLTESTFQKDMKSLLQNPIFSDITIQVGNLAFQIHRFVLAAASPVLGDIAKQPTQIVILNENPRIFGYLLEFIYTGIADVPKVDLKDLKDLSHKYVVTALEGICNMSEKSLKDVDPVRLQWDSWLTFHIGPLEDSPAFTDIILIVEGNKVVANRALLSVRCQRFRGLFTSGMIESRKNEINVDTSLEVFQTFMNFIYKDIADLNETIAVDTLVFASEYIAPNLIEICENFMKSEVTIDNVCEIWILSETYKAHQLWRYCKFFVWLEFDEVSQTEGFKLLPKELLEEIEPLLLQKK